MLIYKKRGDIYEKDNFKNTISSPSSLEHLGLYLYKTDTTHFHILNQSGVSNDYKKLLTSH